MCLITTKRKSRVAKRDIKVWKVETLNGKSPMQRFKYTKGRLEETEFGFKFKNGRRWSVYGKTPIKYLNANHVGWDMRDSDARNGLICIAEGFHAFTKKKFAVKDIGNSVYLNVKPYLIPKGAEYYKDAVGMIVSNKIIKL